MLLDGSREVGGYFIDSANVYAAGTSETFLDEFIAGEREHMVVATKYTPSLFDSTGLTRLYSLMDHHCISHRTATYFSDATPTIGVRRLQ